MNETTHAPDASPDRATVPQAIGPNAGEPDAPAAHQSESALAAFHGVTDPDALADLINPEE